MYNECWKNKFLTQETQNDRLDYLHSACFALNLVFGPNNLLAMAHGVRSGAIFAQKAAVGRLLVFVPMIAISALGLGVVLTISAVFFNFVKVVGTAYLI